MPLGELAGRGGQRQPQLLQPARHPHRPALVPEVPLDLAHDGRGGIGGELHPALVVEPVHRLDQADGGHLGQVVQRLTAVAEPPGQVLDQRDVHPDQPVAQLHPLRGALGQRGQLDEQGPGRLPVRGGGLVPVRALGGSAARTASASSSSPSRTAPGACGWASSDAGSGVGSVGWLIRWASFGSASWEAAGPGSDPPDCAGTVGRRAAAGRAAGPPPDGASVGRPSTGRGPTAELRSRSLTVIPVPFRERPDRRRGRAITSIVPRPGPLAGVPRVVERPAAGRTRRSVQPPAGRSRSVRPSARHLRLVWPPAESWFTAIAGSRRASCAD